MDETQTYMTQFFFPARVSIKFKLMRKKKSIETNYYSPYKI